MYILNTLHHLIRPLSNNVQKYNNTPLIRTKLIELNQSGFSRTFFNNNTVIRPGDITIKGMFNFKFI